MLINLDVPKSTETNFLRCWQQGAKVLGHDEHAVLEHLIDAGTTRGWFPSCSQLVDRFEETLGRSDAQQAVDRLIQFRLIDAGPDGRILSTIGGITSGRTRFAAKADSGTFFLRSAIDCLTIAPTLQKPVTITTTCGHMGAPIQLVFAADGSLLDSTPRTVTAFLPGWDGRSPLADAIVTKSHFFANGDALSDWQMQAGDPDGMPLTEDTFRFIGVEMAAAIAALYVSFSVREL